MVTELIKGSAQRRKVMIKHQVIVFDTGV